MLPAPVVLSVLKTDAPGAQFATCSPAEVLKPTTSCKPSGPMPSGFMQSITILPARLPRLLIAASAADQGVVITTTSACLMASAGALTRSLGSAACFGSAGLRTPQITSSPCLIQARPSVAPTDPAPMIAIRINTSWFRTRTNQAFSALDQKRDTAPSHEQDCLGNRDILVPSLAILRIGRRTAESSSAQLVEKKIKGGDPAVPGNDEISPSVSWRLTRAARYPLDPPAIAQFFGAGNWLISKVRVSSPDHARDAIELVAATVDAAAGVVEHAIFGKDLVDGRAPTRGVVFTENVVKIAGQQGRYAGRHGLSPTAASRSRLDATQLQLKVPFDVDLDKPRQQSCANHLLERLAVARIRLVGQKDDIPKVQRRLLRPIHSVSHMKEGLEDAMGRRRGYCIHRSL